MSNDGNFILGLIHGEEDRESGLPFRVSIPPHLSLSLSEQASWWAGYHKGFGNDKTIS
jgi:hypothetical protein